MRPHKSCKGIPSCNLNECWDRYFATRMGGVLALWTYATKHGTAKCIAAVGDKYMKQVVRFMAQRPHAA